MRCTFFACKRIRSNSHLCINPLSSPLLISFLNIFPTFIYLYTFLLLSRSQKMCTHFYELHLIPIAYGLNYWAWAPIIPWNLRNVCTVRIYTTHTFKRKSSTFFFSSLLFCCHFNLTNHFLNKGLDAKGITIWI